MVKIKFSSKGQNDTTPSISVSELRKVGLLNNLTDARVNDEFELLLISEGGIPTSTTFRVNRENGSTMKAIGWNKYLLKMPKVGNPVMIGVASLQKY